MTWIRTQEEDQILNLDHAYTITLVGAAVTAYFPTAAPVTIYADDEAEAKKVYARIVGKLQVGRVVGRSADAG